MVAKRINTTLVDPQSLTLLLTCQLVALGRNPAILPISVGETVCRIIRKAILCITGPWIREAAETVHLCVKQESGCEAAVHAMKKKNDENDRIGMRILCWHNFEHNSLVKLPGIMRA